MSNLLELFLKNSELVSNINCVCTETELTYKLNAVDSGFQFVDTELGGQKLVRCEMTKEGFPAALVQADFAIAETGSVVINSSDEQKRLATCLCEDLHVVFPLSCLKDSLLDIADYMQEMTSDDASFIAFMTGASRTADIERVLTIGVHGPGKMYVYVVKDA
ncbi:MAG: hypothetical protein C0602_08280 [Denitrovibrio sp.]|nr:MAG: hypothetical protein C0602_08280 [Denitrovibrio sp.]